jgi:serine phosphatase RsbU (regulator of sigma subunit)
MSSDERGWRELLEAVIGGSAVGMVVSDARGTVVIANAAAQNLLGGELGRAVGTPAIDAQSEILKWRFKNPDEYEQKAVSALRSGAAEQWEQETVEDVVLAIDLTPLTARTGRILGHVQSFGDVTTLRREFTDTLHEVSTRLEDLEQHERQVAEQAALTRAAYQIAVALTPEEVYRRLVNEAARLASTDRLAVIQGSSRREHTVMVARGFAGADAERLADEARAAVGRAVVGRRTLVCNDSEHESSDAAHAARVMGLRALMLVPIALAERVYGVLAVCADEPRTFGEREVRLLNELAGHAATALSNAQQFVRNRELAESFQDSVVARDLPAVPGLELAAFYRAAAGELTGGDFYDVLALEDGRVAIVVGDVSGKGPRAAATTAMVRHMIEGLVASRSEPEEITLELNRLLCARLEEGSLVTTFIAVYEPETGLLSWCNAGHPAPLLAQSEGGIRPLGHPGPACGCLTDAHYDSFTTTFEVGETLVLYTDGLTEARRDGEEFGPERVRAEVAAMAGRAATSVPRRLYAAVRAFARGQVDDDVAIVVVRRSD